MLLIMDVLLKSHVHDNIFCASTSMHEGEREERESSELNHPLLHSRLTGDRITGYHANIIPRQSYINSAHAYDTRMRGGWAHRECLHNSSTW